MPDDPTAHLDAAYDSAPTRELLTELGFTGDIARKGVPAPIQAGGRWVVERTNSWTNGYGKLRRCTDRNGHVVNFYLYLAAPSSSYADSSNVPATATAGPTDQLRKG